MARFPPNIDAGTFTISAYLIGYLLLDDLNPAEQNSIGNWFMMVGQVLCTNSAQQQVINNRNNNKDGNHVINSNDTSFESLKRSVNTMSQELDKYS